MNQFGFCAPRRLKTIGVSSTTTLAVYVSVKPLHSVSASAPSPLTMGAAKSSAKARVTIPRNFVLFCSVFIYSLLLT